MSERKKKEKPFRLPACPSLITPPFLQKGQGNLSKARDNDFYVTVETEANKNRTLFPTKQSYCPPTTLITLDNRRKPKLQLNDPLLLGVLQALGQEPPTPMFQLPPTAPEVPRRHKVEVDLDRGVFRVHTEGLPPTAYIAYSCPKPNLVVGTVPSRDEPLMEEVLKALNNHLGALDDAGLLPSPEEVARKRTQERSPSHTADVGRPKANGL
jgi:hypothetical protein